MYCLQHFPILPTKQVTVTARQALLYDLLFETGAIALKTGSFSRKAALLTLAPAFTGRPKIHQKEAHQKEAPQKKNPTPKQTPKF